MIPKYEYINPTLRFKFCPPKDDNSFLAGYGGVWLQEKKYLFHLIPYWVDFKYESVDYSHVEPYQIEKIKASLIDEFLTYKSKVDSANNTFKRLS